eukprot:m.124686 g.124686  ORF g.124686 m.124686 type:complete len:723 (-) comp22086_c1_seq6:840-3008(-)
MSSSPAATEDVEVHTNVLRSDGGDAPKKRADVPPHHRAKAAATGGSREARPSPTMMAEKQSGAGKPPAEEHDHDPPAQPEEEVDVDVKGLDVGDGAPAPEKTDTAVRRFPQRTTAVDEDKDADVLGLEEAFAASTLDGGDDDGSEVRLLLTYRPSKCAVLGLSWKDHKRNIDDAGSNCFRSFYTVPHVALLQDPVTTRVEFRTVPRALLDLPGNAEKLEFLAEHVSDGFANPTHAAANTRAVQSLSSVPRTSELDPGAEVIRIEWDDITAFMLVAARPSKRAGWGDVLIHYGAEHHPLQPRVYPLLMWDEIKDEVVGTLAEQLDRLWQDLSVARQGTENEPPWYLGVVNTHRTLGLLLTLVPPTADADDALLLSVLDELERTVNRGSGDHQQTREIVEKMRRFEELAPGWTATPLAHFTSGIAPADRRKLVGSQYYLDPRWAPAGAGILPPTLDLIWREARGPRGSRKPPFWVSMAVTGTAEAAAGRKVRLAGKQCRRETSRLCGASGRTETADYKVDTPAELVRKLAVRACTEFTEEIGGWLAPGWLPPGWTVEKSKSTNKVYFHNHRTQESTYTRPSRIHDDGKQVKFLGHPVVLKAFTIPSGGGRCGVQFQVDVGDISLDDFCNTYFGTPPRDIGYESFGRSIIAVPLGTGYPGDNDAGVRVLDSATELVDPGRSFGASFSGQMYTFGVKPFEFPVRALLERVAKTIVYADTSTDGYFT